MREIAWYNGVLSTIEDARIPANDRAFYFGDGIYDVATVRKKVCFALEDHLDRFFNNARLLRLNLKQTREEVREICLGLLEQLDDGIEEAVLYFQASRGTAPRGHAFPEQGYANLYFTLKPAAFKKFGTEVSAILKEDIRFYMCHIKTLNLLPNVLAQQEAKEKGCYETILHRGDRVTEGSHSTVAYFKDGVFCTPPADELILPSITRKHYVALCEKIGIPVRIAPFTVEELLNADEILIMSTTALMMRCTTVDGKKVGGKDPAVLAKVEAAYKNKILAETER